MEDYMLKLNRRDAISMAGSGAVVALTGATLSHANAREDAELLRLWEEWKSRWAQCRVNNAHFCAVEWKIFSVFETEHTLVRVSAVSATNIQPLDKIIIA